MTIDPPSEADAGVPADSPVVKEGGSADDKIRKRAYLIWVDEGRPRRRPLAAGDVGIEGEPGP
jgi:hypothetical protein